MPPEIEAALVDSDLPSDLTNWLARLRLLMGVPFQNLVADERLLEPESIKFFRVDPAWLNALIDGALSIGRHHSAADGTSPALVAEQVHGRRLHESVQSSVTEIRRRQLKKPERQEPIPISAIVSGFLLRSKVVSGWRSMDVMGYEQGQSPFDNEQSRISPDQVAPMALLRLELLSPMVLLGLFQGQLYELVLHQPPEAIHFGFQTISFNGGQVTKNLRVPGTNWDDRDTSYDTQGHQLQELDGVFTDRSRRVIDMMRLSQALARKLDAAGKAPGYYAKQTDDNHQSHLLSSDFALEMVQGVGLVSFINQALPGGKSS